MPKLVWLFFSSLLSTLLFFFTILPSPALATDYYVALSGSDSNPGTQSQPFATIQKAANIVSSGDIVTVFPGEYPQRITIDNSGTDNNNISFQAQGEVTTQGFIVNGNHITIKGFRLESITCDWGIQGSGIYINGDHCLIENNYAYYNPQNGFVLSDQSEQCVVKNNKAEKNIMAGIYIHGKNHLIENNEVWNTVQKHSSGCNGDADGIRFFGSGHIIKNNYIHDIHFDGNLVTNAHIDCFQTWSDSYHQAATSVIIEKNFCETLTYTANDHGSGMVIANSDNLLIKNNIFLSYRGINEGGSGPNTNLKIINNVLASSTDFPTNLYPMGLSFSTVNGGVIINNIFYNFNSHIVNGHYPNGQISHNIAYNSNGTTPQLTACSSGCTVTDPKFIDPQSFDFHLQTNSPAINAGKTIAEVTQDLDGTSRPQGNNYDIGVYEYSSVAPTPSPSPTSNPSPLPCTGDINQDNRVDLSDYFILVQNFLKTNFDPASDLDNSGRVDLSDYFLLVQNFLKPCN